MQITVTFDDGSSVTKTLPQHDDERTMAMSFNRKMTEAWRDYLYNKYGDRWSEVDPMVGMFWKVPEMQ